MKDKIYHAMMRLGTRLVDILLGSRDAMEFWQAAFGLWWGIIMIHTKPGLLYNVYEPLIEVAPGEVWGGLIALSSLVVLGGLFVVDVLKVNGGAVLARKWGMTIHAFVLFAIFASFLNGHGWLGSTATAAYGILAGNAATITLRLWICHRLKQPC